MKKTPILISIDFENDEAITLLRTPGAKVCATITRVDAKTMTVRGFLDRAADTIANNPYLGACNPAMDYAPDNPDHVELRADFFAPPPIWLLIALYGAIITAGIVAGYLLTGFFGVL